jgi:hypothetical protein
MRFFTLTLWSIGAVVLGGLLCFPFFSDLPFFWGVGLAVVFIACFSVAELTRRQMSISAYVTALYGYTAVFGIVIATFVGVEREEIYSCNWKTESGAISVDLSSIGGFGWTRVVSDELAEHLKKDEPSKVQVRVAITRDFGRIRAHRMIRTVDEIAVREP